MGNPPDANLPAFALDTLDTWSVRHHLHESVSQRALSLSLFLPTLLPPILFLSHVRQNRRPRLAHEYARHANSPPTQSLFSFLSEGTGHRDVSRCGCAPTCCRSRDREAARGRVGAWVRFVPRQSAFPLALKRTRGSACARRYTSLGRVKSVSPTHTR